MSKKLAVLAAAYGLPAPFTILDLASRAGVSASTAQTVLSRTPEDWFAKAPLRSGGRGGQPIGYTLSDTGRQAIEGSFEKVNVMPRLAPEQPPFEVPLGLLSAQATVRDLGTAPTAALAGLREDALGNLEWAETEVRDGRFGDKSYELLTQIARLREQLRDRKAAALVGTVGVGAKKAPAQVQTRSLMTIAREQFSNWKNLLSKEADAASGQGQPAYVWIGYLDANEGSRDLATFAKGALTGAFQCTRTESKTPLNLVVEPFEADLIMSTSRQILSATFKNASELFLCVNSTTNEMEVQRALEQVNEANMPKATVVLDEGFSAQVELYARQHDISYTPNATQPERMAWIGQAISG